MAESILAREKSHRTKMCRICGWYHPFGERESEQGFLFQQPELRDELNAETPGKVKTLLDKMNVGSDDTVHHHASWIVLVQYGIASRAEDGRTFT